MAIKFSLFSHLSEAISKTVEVPVISTASPELITPASIAAAEPSTVPAITGIP